MFFEGHAGKQPRSNMASKFGVSFELSQCCDRALRPASALASLGQAEASGGDHLCAHEVVLVHVLRFFSSSKRWSNFFWGERFRDWVVRSPFCAEKRTHFQQIVVVVCWRLESLDGNSPILGALKST